MSVKITTEAIIALISKHYGIVPDELGEAASSQFDLRHGQWPPCWREKCRGYG